MFWKLGRKRVLIIVTIFFIFITLGVFIFNQTKEVDNQSISTSGIVAFVEKSFIEYHWRKITFEDFENNTNEYVHPHYKESYFSEMKKSFDTGVVALNVKSAQDIQISKPYMNIKEDRQVVFVKIPMDDSTSIYCKTYTFARHGGIWKMLQVTQDYIVKDNPKYDKIAEQFTNYNGKPIEYSNLEVK